MKVKELIEVLNGLDPEMRVRRGDGCDDDGCCNDTADVHDVLDCGEYCVIE
ncbi:MAG: hypothetical protein WC262_11845 [Bacteroidales bacterium]